MGAGASSNKGEQPARPPSQPHGGELRPVTASGSAMGAADGQFMQAPDSLRRGGEKAAPSKARGVESWQPEEEESDREDEEAITSGPSQELVHEVRRCVRERKANLLQVLQGGGHAGESKSEVVDLATFRRVLRTLLGESKHGLVERGAADLFEALDPHNTDA